MYAAAVQSVLMDYPRDVVEFVTDPRTGIQSKIKWLPKIAEIHEACRDVLERINDDAKRARDLKEQFALRDRYEAEMERKKLNSTREDIERILGRKVAWEK